MLTVAGVQLTGHVDEAVKSPQERTCGLSTG